MHAILDDIFIVTLELRQQKYWPYSEMLTHEMNY